MAVAYKLKCLIISYVAIKPINCVHNCNKSRHP